MTINLLLVDDMESYYEAYSLINSLFSDEYDSHIYWANDLESTLKILQERDYNIALVDTSLYREDIGPQIADKIHELRPNLRIIGMSNADNAELWEGKFEYVGKTSIDIDWFKKFYEQCKAYGKNDN
jgi:DNA-binding NtrC family response regulator